MDGAPGNPRVGQAGDTVVSMTAKQNAYQGFFTLLIKWRASWVERPIANSGSGPGVPQGDLQNETGSKWEHLSDFAASPRDPQSLTSDLSVKLIACLWGLRSSAAETKAQWAELVAGSPLGGEIAFWCDQQLIPVGVVLKHFGTDLKVCKCSAGSDVRD